MSPAEWTKDDGDDLARQQTCHVVQTVMTQVVVTVHISPGGQRDPSCPSSALFTQKAGATLPSATWQTTMTESQYLLMMDNE